MNGHFDPRFAELVELFVEQGAGLPGGSSLAVFQGGEPVVDVWQGEERTGEEWTADTVSVVFSCTKGLASLLAHRLVEEGRLDLDAPVSQYWPEFADNGKRSVPVKWLLQHKAGLSAVRRDLTFDEVIDGHTVEDELAGQEPLWEPGTAHSYHALTFGTLVGKLVRSVTGITIGEYFAETIARPLGVRAWIGLPESEFHHLAPLVADPKRGSGTVGIPGSDDYWVSKAMTFGTALDGAVDDVHKGFNNPALIRAEIPGAGGVSNARGLAAIYSAAVTETAGIRLLTDKTIRAAMVHQSTGPMFFEKTNTVFPAWGNGFMIEVPGFVDMLGTGSFGHNGLGGQSAFGDVDHRVGFGFTTSYLGAGDEEQSRQQALVRVLRRILA
jgi:CubicO group peptidase (beta-lactamase class C family)